MSDSNFRIIVYISGGILVLIIAGFFWYRKRERTKSLRMDKAYLHLLLMILDKANEFNAEDYTKLIDTFYNKYAGTVGSMHYKRLLTNA